MTPVSRRRLVVAIASVAAGIMLQAILAGLFLSGEHTRIAHTVIGSLLPWYAFVPAVLAVRRRHWLPVPVWMGSAALPLALWLQSVLGHVPWPSGTAVHVPLGVLLFGASLTLTGAAGRIRTGINQHPTHAADVSGAAGRPAS